jgi:hypothetical protein
MATTWALDACAAASTAEPASAELAALSARIAGMMMVRLMRMIPPCRLHSSAACCMASLSRVAQLSQVELLPILGYFIHSVRHYLHFMQILNSAIYIGREYAFLGAGEMLAIPALQGSAQFAPRGAAGRDKSAVERRINV